MNLEGPEVEPAETSPIAAVKAPSKESEPSRILTIKI